MNSYLIDKQEPCVADFFRRMEKTIKMLDKSDILKISRRTLQEYRSAGRIPYYLICGKVIYKESEIQQFLEDGRKQCLDEMELL